MGTFTESIKNIFNTLLPIVGVIVLVVVVILLIELIKTIKSANNLLNKSVGTVDLVDESLKKVQAPLDSAVKVSNSIDTVHDATVKGIGEAKDFINKNANKIKDKISELTSSNNDENDKNTEDEVPGPNDIFKEGE